MNKHIVLLLLLCTSVFAQKGSVKGKVVSNGVNQELVNVYIAGTTIGTTTDSNGNFILKNVPVGKQKIIASFIGFKTQSKKVVVQQGKTKTIHFDLQEDNSLDEVVISGTLKPVKKLDSPVPVEVYTKTFFELNPVPTLFEGMSNVNGVRPQVNCSVCNTGDIHINGLEGPYTFILIDGMPIVSGLSTVYGLNGIPQSLIERIEIVKGSASSLYGSEAVGGIINVITKNPEKAPTFATDVFATHWGEINTDIGAKYNLGKKTNGLIGVNYFNYSNTIDNNGDGFTDKTLQDRISIFNKISFKRKNDKIFNIAGRYIYEDRWGGQTNWEQKYRGGDEVYGESIYTSRWETFGTYQFQTNEDISFQFSANGHHQNSFYGTDSFNADQYIGFGQLIWHTNFGENHDFTLAGAYRYTYYDDNTFATPDKASITHLPGIFIQDEITLDSQNKLLLGLRYDYNNVHGNVFSPRINYKWNSQDKNDVIRVSLGNGFRVANVFTEDHAALTGAREVIFEGELSPETSWNNNINYTKKIVTGNGNFINIDASAFYTYFDNKIIPDYETDPNKIIYKNLDGYAESKGISINTDMNFTNGFSVLLGATLMNVTTTEKKITERQLLTESFSGTWSISYDIKDWDIKIDYTGNVYGPMDLPILGDNDPRSPTSPWYSIQNLQFTKTFNNNFQIYGGVKNLLDFTPASNSILRANDPFDKNLDPQNPNLTFDPSYVYASNQGINGFIGFRYKI